MNPPDIHGLIGGLRQQDRDAFTQIVRIYEQSMLRTAYRIVGQQSDAEEVRQTILLRLWQSPEKIPEVNSFGCWIRRCVINEAIEILRRRNREDRRNKDSGQFSSSSVDEANWDDEATRLRNALRALEPEQRAILSLRFDEQCTIREIGNTLEQPHTTIQSKLDRAITRLRQLLDVSVKNVE